MSVRGPNNVGRAVQTDPTLLRHASAITEQKKCWELLAEKFDRFQTAQQHATTSNKQPKGEKSSKFCFFSFTYRNAKMTEARQCWLINDEEMEQTHETAIEIRQLIAVRNYLFSLDVSDERKVRLLERNRRILGNLHSALQEDLELTKVTVNCVIV